MMHYTPMLVAQPSGTSVRRRCPVSLMNKHNGILLSYKKRWTFAIFSNKDGTGGGYTQWNKSEEERQMPDDFTHVEYRENKQTNKKFVMLGSLYQYFLPPLPSVEQGSLWGASVVGPSERTRGPALVLDSFLWALFQTWKINFELKDMRKKFLQN